MEMNLLIQFPIKMAVIRSVREKDAFHPLAVVIGSGLTLVPAASHIHGGLTLIMSPANLVCVYVFTSFLPSLSLSVQIILLNHNFQSQDST